MPRRPRICPAGTCFHVINRAVARLDFVWKVWRLRCIRAGAGGGLSAHCFADLWICGHAQPLALRSSIQNKNKSYRFLFLIPFICLPKLHQCSNRRRRAVKPSTLKPSNTIDDGSGTERTETCVISPPALRLQIPVTGRDRVSAFGGALRRWGCFTFGVPDVVFSVGENDLWWVAAWNCPIAVAVVKALQASVLELRVKADCPQGEVPSTDRSFVAWQHWAVDPAFRSDGCLSGKRTFNPFLSWVHWSFAAEPSIFTDAISSVYSSPPLANVFTVTLPSAGHANPVT